MCANKICLSFIGTILILTCLLKSSLNRLTHSLPHVLTALTNLNSLYFGS